MSILDTVTFYNSEDEPFLRLFGFLLKRLLMGFGTKFLFLLCLDFFNRKAIKKINNKNRINSNMVLDIS